MIGSPIGAVRSVKGERVGMRTFCRVCLSSQQALIDRRLLDGERLVTLSADYGLPVRELRHHRDAHVFGRSATTRRREAHSCVLHMTTGMRYGYVSGAAEAGLWSWWHPLGAAENDTWRVGPRLF